MYLLKINEIKKIKTIRSYKYETIDVKGLEIIWPVVAYAPKAAKKQIISAHSLNFFGLGSHGRNALMQTFANQVLSIVKGGFGGFLYRHMDARPMIQVFIYTLVGILLISYYENCP